MDDFRDEMGVDLIVSGEHEELLKVATARTAAPPRRVLLVSTPTTHDGAKTALMMADLRASGHEVELVEINSPQLDKYRTNNETLQIHIPSIIPQRISSMSYFPEAAAESGDENDRKKHLNGPGRPKTHPPSKHPSGLLARMFEKAGLEEPFHNHLFPSLNLKKPK